VRQWREKGPKRCPNQSVSKTGATVPAALLSAVVIRNLLQQNNLRPGFIGV
jgi:hypothetical protein